MPAKGKTLKIGQRRKVIGREMYKTYKENTENPVDYKTFIKIILETNEEIKNWVLNDPSGFMLPQGLGFIAVNKFKPYKKPVDYVHSKQYKKRIPNLNLHTYGYTFYINWFNNGLRFVKSRSYGFDAERKFNRALKVKIMEGKVPYNKYDKRHFKNLFLSKIDDE